MPKIIDKNKTSTVSSFKRVIDELPYNTVDVKKAIADEKIIDRSTVDKWYGNKGRVTDIHKLIAIINFLNSKYPRADKRKLTLNDLIKA